MRIAQHSALGSGEQEIAGRLPSQLAGQEARNRDRTALMSLRGADRCAAVDFGDRFDDLVGQATYPAGGPRSDPRQEHEFKMRQDLTTKRYLVAQLASVVARRQVLFRSSSGVEVTPSNSL